LDVAGDLSSGYVTLDGTLGKPEIRAGTPQAIAMARANFPRVGKCFRLKQSTKLFTILQETFAYAPMLKAGRPISEVQLQCYYENEADKRGLLPYPIRVQLRVVGEADEKWHDVTSNTGIRLTSDGLIYFDGLADDCGDSDDWLLDSPLEGLKPASPMPAMKEMKVNLAIPLDTRPWRIANVEDSDPFNISGKVGTTWPTYKLIFDPKGFMYHYQFNSNPCLASFIQTGAAFPNNLALLPITRTIRDDRSELLSHSTRRLKEFAKLNRHSSWKLIGIRPEFWAGSFIREVNLRYAEENYPIFHALETVTFDFINQVTVCGPYTDRHRSLKSWAAPGEEEAD
jgi:hypothetical protein